MFKRLTLFFFLLFTGMLLLAQGTSNKGTDFWLGYGNHVNGYSNNSQQMAIYVTSDVATSVTVAVPGVFYTQTQNVGANSVTTFDIPQSAYLGATTVAVNKGIHITAAKPVVAYAHVYNQSVSGATLVLPTNALGKDYYSINYTQTANSTDSFCWFFVVAVEDNTQIVITPAASNQNGLAVGVESAAINLSKGDVYQVLGTAGNITGGSAGSDLTGSKIRSVSTTAAPCKKIAVFSGSGKISIGCATNNAPGSSDNLYQQVYPTATWGKTFITVPLKSRNYDIYRIIKSDPAAVVKLNGAVVPAASFVNNFYYEFSGTTVNSIESDQPIQVVQYATTQNRGLPNCATQAETNGDPEMIFLNPLEQTLKTITMFSSGKYLIRTHFINVVMPTGDVASFKLDGIDASGQFAAVPGVAGYSYAQLSVTEGIHNLSANGGFNAIAYGFGQAESYGYAAGANLVSKGIEAVNGSQKTTSTGCVGEAFKFQIPLPYTPTDFKIDLGDGLKSIPVTATGSYQENNITYTVYELAKDLFFTKIQTYPIQLFVGKSNSDCGSIEEYSIDFPVYELPAAKFELPAEACIQSAVSFTDKSTGDAVNKLTNWFWDFGDNTFSTDQNPKHTYQNSGTYDVKLTVQGESGCSAPVSMQTIRINALPVARFTVGALSCEKLAISFTDQSTSADGTIVSRTWHFGDGKDTTVTAAGPVNHVYDTHGTYTVTLDVTTDKTCRSVQVSLPVIVRPLPVPDFELPDFCLNDAFARFTNKSTISDNSALTYAWDFGDRHATAARPNTSTQASPVHNYTQVGIYTVRLTVTSAYGCVAVLEKEFTVNGSIPKAAFTVQNENALCSSDSVHFTDNSSVDFGEITKIDWYFDADGSPTVKFTDNDPALRLNAPRSYAWLYPVLRAPLYQRTVRVRMVVYSGGSCTSETSKTITLKAVPLVAFDALPDICQEAGIYSIGQARETTAHAGTAVFSGKGVTATGLFDPLLAGPGTHAITYTFTGTNGCSAAVTQTITVQPTPKADAGADRKALEGQEVTLTGTGTGHNVSYRWTPSTGLSDDDIPAPVFTATDDITYTLTVTTAEGCSHSDPIFIKVLKAPVAPNTFTPNGDGINDTWEIPYLKDYAAPVVDVFNRNGEQVYRSAGYTIAWDGTRNGSQLPSGVYFYIINPGSGRKPVYGSVAILR